MPMFDVICERCKVELDDIFVPSNGELRCPICGYLVRKKPSRFFPDVFPSDGIFLEHVSATGKRFYSRKEMKEYAKANNLELGALG